MYPNPILWNQRAIHSWESFQRICPTLKSLPSFFHREPLGLLVKSFFFGVLSIFITLILSTIVDQFITVNEKDVSEQAVHAFFIVALIEEFSKFIFVRGILYNNKNFNEPFDGIVYSVMVGMGFATFENVLYVFENGVGTAILRMFTAVPAHAMFAVLMGYSKPIILFIFLFILLLLSRTGRSEFIGSFQTIVGFAKPVNKGQRFFIAARNEYQLTDLSFGRIGLLRDQDVKGLVGGLDHKPVVFITKIIPGIRRSFEKNVEYRAPIFIFANFHKSFKRAVNVISPHIADPQLTLTEKCFGLL